MAWVCTGVTKLDGQNSILLICDEESRLLCLLFLFDFLLYSSSFRFLLLLIAVWNWCHGGDWFYANNKLEVLIGLLLFLIEKPKYFPKSLSDVYFGDFWFPIMHLNIFLFLEKVFPKIFLFHSKKKIVLWMLDVPENIIIFLPSFWNDMGYLRMVRPHGFKFKDFRSVEGWLLY